jgi:WXG100 protein secretion system (Wss), protein YukD
VPADELERIAVIIATTMAARKWEANLPIDVPVARLITKLIEAPGMPFGQNLEGDASPYRLMWAERDRYLGEAETLREAGVQGGDTLVMAHEARAGRAEAIVAGAV